MNITLHDRKGKCAYIEIDSDIYPALITYEDNFYKQSLFSDVNVYHLANPILVIPDGDLKWTPIN